VITLDLLQEMFADIKARNKWNLEGDLLWGYFFTDPDPKKLQPLADHLTKAGYNFVDIFLADDEEIYFLHVEKVEHHTPETLDRRNQDFYQLADQFNLESYDGMDVGPVE
jgi:Regulator of ribonuclease activity B